MDDWFTMEQIAPDTWRLSEYRHWAHGGGHWNSPAFYAPALGLPWLQGA